MGSKFKRIQNIDEQIQSVKLPYNAWKVLFVVGDAATPEQITELLEMEKDEVQKALDRLHKEELIETESPDQSKEKAAETEEAKESADQEEEPQTDQPDENAKTEIQEEVADKPAAHQQSEDEIVEELLGGGSKSETETPPKETEDKEVEINISEETDTDEDKEKLDMDFSGMLDQDKQTPQKESVEEKAPPKSGNTVLVIDDSIVIRKMVEIALENEDFHIETAVSGKEGVEKLDELQPAIVILDLMLPDINGIDVLKTIKASKGIPVIMLSGKDSPKMVEKAKNEGADDFLPKPFKDEELVEKIKALT
ncbi:MAG: response regulator [Caldithrix sp.]|nr:response regulator [Caldithrix sp.]